MTFETTDTAGRRRSRLISPAVMGAANRSRVLELLHQNGPTSRAQLARALGVTRATIATILQPLIDDATLVEGDAVASSPAGGKPGRPLWFNAEGIELGSMRIAATMITAARLGVDGRIRVQDQRSIDPGAPIGEIEATMVGLGRACFASRPLLGIGVAASGMVDTAAGMIISLHLAPVFNGYPLGPVLQEAFGVPVSVDHHPRVQALGDRWFGAGRQLDSFASVYTGEALGLGIVHGGEIISGAAGAGGEYGHTVVDLNGTRCLCGRTGCWETVATTGWLRLQAAERGLPATDCAELSVLADAGDGAADELLDLYARNLAIGMANNEQMIASGTYIIHGDVCAGGPRMRAALSRWLARFSPHRGAAPTVIMDGVGDEITLLGGGGLVLSAHL